MAAAEKDPLVSAFFTIDFGGTVAGAFRECTGLGSENEVVEYKASGDKGKYVMKKIPGRMKWNNITLKRGLTTSNELYKWYLDILQGKFRTQLVTVAMFDAKGGDPLAEWVFLDAYPVKWSGPQFVADGKAVAVETLELTHAGLRIA